jgi:hypothetical protein
MWPTSDFIIRISMGSRKLLWPTTLGQFSVITTSTWVISLRVIVLDTHMVETTPKQILS